MDISEKNLRDNDMHVVLHYEPYFYLFIYFYSHFSSSKLVTFLLYRQTRYVSSYIFKSKFSN